MQVAAETEVAEAAEATEAAQAAEVAPPTTCFPAGVALLSPNLTFLLT